MAKRDRLTLLECQTLCIELEMSDEIAFERSVQTKDISYQLISKTLQALNFSVKTKKEIKVVELY